MVVIVGDDLVGRWALVKVHRGCDIPEARVGAGAHVAVADEAGLLLLLGNEAVVVRVSLSETVVSGGLEGVLLKLRLRAERLLLLLRSEGLLVLLLRSEGRLLAART